MWFMLAQTAARHGSPSRRMTWTR